MALPSPAPSGIVLTLLWAFVLLGGSACAQQEQAVNSGIQYLRGRSPGKGVGESAMIALALVKADTPQNDSILQTCIAAIQKRFTASGYFPERRGGPDIYEAGVAAMVLANLEGDHRGEISAIATYLMGKQKANGSWDYDSRTTGDASITQYALLGLWECENAGFSVPPSVWDRAAGWYLSVQGATGGWNYHRDEPHYLEDVAMTSAGVGSLLLCRRQLSQFRQSQRENNPLLTPIAVDNPYRDYDIQSSSARIDQAVRKGLGWLVTNYTTTETNRIGRSIYYTLYGLERVAAFSERSPFGKADLLEKARSFIRSKQRGDGSWNAPPLDDEMNTVWAILFLTKSTAKSIKRVTIKRLGAGTLVGGRGLPTDLTAITVAGGRIMSRPMNGAVEGMLAVLEDPRAQTADAAVSGLIVRFQREGPDVLRPYKDRFRKLLSDRDAGMRQVAAWALARTADLDVFPDLITAIVDPEESVVTAARTGLQLLSRKIEGLGPPSPSSPEQRQEAARAWRAWYESIRPLDVDADDRVIRRSAPAPAPSAAGRAGSPTP